MSAENTNSPTTTPSSDEPPVFPSESSAEQTNQKHRRVVTIIIIITINIYYHLSTPAFPATRVGPSKLPVTNNKRTLGAKTAELGRPGNGDDVVALFALAYRVVVHLCAHRVLVVLLARVVLETLFPQPWKHERISINRIVKVTTSLSVGTTAVIDYNYGGNRHKKKSYDFFFFFKFPAKTPPSPPPTL